MLETAKYSDAVFGYWEIDFTAALPECHYKLLYPISNCQELDMLTELNNTNFDPVIKQGLVVVDFWADWCGPCRALAPTIEELAGEHPEITFAKLNVDEHPELASRHGVMSIPTLMFFVDGELKDSSIGVVPKTVIEKKLELLRG